MVGSAFYFFEKVFFWDTLGWLLLPQTLIIYYKYELQHQKGLNQFTKPSHDRLW